MSGGKELEDIQEYGRLYSILNNIQGSTLNDDEHSLTHHSQYGSTINSNVTATTVTPALTDAQIVAAGTDGTNNLFDPVDAALATIRTKVNNQIDAQVNNGAFRYNAETQVAANGSVTFNVPIISAIFNIDKCFPLLLTDQGLDIYLHLESTNNIGVWSADAPDDYHIKDVKYIAHEVNLDDSFVNQMKASMSATGGVLSLTSTTYRYNLVNDDSAASSATKDLNIAVRTKSLKGLIVKPMSSTFNENRGVYSLSPGQACGIRSVQFRVGSVLYPQSAIQYNNDGAAGAINKGELFNEVRKCFGTIGGYNYGTRLNQATLPNETGAEAVNKLDATHGTSPQQNTTQQNFIFAYDFETFAKSATESGLNTSDRALPVTMQINRSLGQAAGGVRYDTYAMCDCIIYISQNGEIFTRI